MRNQLKIFSSVPALLAATQLFAQNYQPSDTLVGIDSVIISAPAFGIKAQNLSGTALRKLETLSPGNLVNAINAVPGVRMEERSPGSYRLNIRGSSLRSPFGVRNVKMYWNGIPFTDASGNTYFNQLDPGSIHAMQILRGPAGSMYGAGTGGLVLMESITMNAGHTVDLTAGGGSFKNAFLQAALKWGKENAAQKLFYGYNTNDGYRDQSAMQRTQLAFTSQLKTSGENTSLVASVLFTDLYYQTPGGLTLAEFTANPKAARPAAGAFPSAAQVNAAIWQTNILSGITLYQKIASRWKNTSSVAASLARIRNSAIRNFEERSEPQVSARTNFEFNSETNGWNINWQTGGELQLGWFNTQVSRNKNGQRDSLLSNDDLMFKSGFGFTQLYLSKNKFALMAGTSLNLNSVSITRLSQLPVVKQKRDYGATLAPRFQLTYNWNKLNRTQVTISRGFSPPTSGELLPGNSIINTALNAETGMNYELGHQLRFAKAGFISATFFYFDLNNTIVQQRDAGGGDFFINAGRARQPGIEIAAAYTVAGQRWHNSVNANYTYSNFKFEEYNKSGTDYSGNNLPGVPKHGLHASYLLEWNKQFEFYFNYYHNSSIALNDANTFYANPFHVFGSKLQYRFLFNKVFVTFYAGVENLFDRTYSLGNDINAAGNRFYNAAPGRRYFGGLRFQR